MKIENEDQKLGTCSWCHKENVLIYSNEYCEDCDSEIYHCLICNADYTSDDCCRHLFRDRDYEWSGSGAGEPSETVKRSFLLLLALMPDNFALEVAGAIKAGKFHTWLIAPLIGSGGLLELNGTKDYERNWDLGNALLRLGGADQAEETADGYHWLASLYQDDTPEANTITITWINEFLKEKTNGSAI
jgi:hypothetical protein